MCMSPVGHTSRIVAHKICTVNAGRSERPNSPLKPKLGDRAATRRGGGYQLCSVIRYVTRQNNEASPVQQAEGTAHGLIFNSLESSFDADHIFQVNLPVNIHLGITSVSHA